MVKQSQISSQVKQGNFAGSRSVGVRLSEILASGIRLEASAYALEARKALAELDSSSHGTVPLLGSNGPGIGAHNGTRFPRVYVKESYGVPFLSSSDIIGLRPERGVYISRKHTPSLEKLLIKPWTVLLSRSGTIGNVSLATPRMQGWALSEDVIRISAQDPDNAGFICAFLRSHWGRSQTRGHTYGSVVQHIEVQHLKQIRIPNLPSIQRIAIGRAFVDAAVKRDEANEKLDRAHLELHSVLNVPALPDVKGGPATGTIRASNWATRLDASYHNPTAQWVISQLTSNGYSLTKLSDPVLTKEIKAVTKFRKRVYIPFGGIPLLSSKQLFQIDPIDRKGLAKGAHTSDMDEIELQTNMVMVTCSGTNGKVQIVPRYMSGWGASQDALRVVGVDDITAGFIYAWLSSDLGQCLLKRHQYGSVITHLDRNMLSSVIVPFLDEVQRTLIGKLVIEANELRDEAWNLEQKALAQLKKEITG